MVIATPQTRQCTVLVHGPRFRPGFVSETASPARTLPSELAVSCVILQFPLAFVSPPDGTRIWMSMQRQYASFRVPP